MDNENEKKIDIRTVITAIFRRKFLVVLIILLGIAAAYFGSKFQTPQYEASVKMHIKGISQVVTDYYQGIGEGNIRGTQIEIVKSEPVLRRVVQTLNLDKVPLDFEKNYSTPLKRILIDFFTNRMKKKLAGLPDELRQNYLFDQAMNSLLANLFIDIIPGTDIIRLTVRDFDPDRAVEIANVISRAYTIIDQQQQLAELRQKFGEAHPAVMQVEANINEAAQKLTGKRLPDIEAIGTASVKIIEQARTDYRPIGKPRIMIFLMIFGASIAFSLGLAFALDFINQKLKSIDDIIISLNLPVIGSIPKKNFFLKKDTFKDMQPDSLYSQFSEDLADQFYVFMKTQKLHTVLMTSIQRSEGTTNITANIAYRLSEMMSCSTLLIDANFYHPKQQKLFNINLAPGFANILERYPIGKDTVQPDSAEQNAAETVTHVKNIKNELNALIEKKVQAINENLHILPSGKFDDNPSYLLNEKILKIFFDLLKKKYDVILIDASCIKGHKYVEKLMLLVDGTTLIVNENKIKRGIAKSIISTLRKKNVNFIGAVLNNRTFPIPQVIYKRL